MTTRPGLPLYMTLEKSLFARLLQSAAVSSVTRLGDFLDFGLLFKAFGNNYFVQISHIVTQYFAKVSKSIIFLVKSFLGNFYRHLATFYWSHWQSVNLGSYGLKVDKYERYASSFFCSEKGSRSSSGRSSSSNDIKWLFYLFNIFLRSTLRTMLAWSLTLCSKMTPKVFSKTRKNF